MTDVTVPSRASASTARVLMGDEARPRRAWIAFAGGLESFNVPIVYVLFAPYLASRVAGSSVEGQELIAYTLTVAGVFASLLSPPLAFVAEHAGRRRALMLLFLALNAASAFVFWFAAPASPLGPLLLVLFAYGVATMANDLLYVFYASILPEIAPPSILGRTSGLATALGWAIALVATAVFLAAFVLPPQPLFGLDRAAGEAERLSGPFAGALMLVLCAPLLLMPQPRAPERPKRTLAQWLKEETASLLSERAAAKVVLARLVYWSGVALVMSFGNVIATAIMGWGSTGTSLFGMAVLVAGAVGAGFGGVFDDRLGSRDALCLALVGLAVSLGLILTMSPDRLFGLIPVAPRPDGAPDLSSTAEYVLLALGAVTGLFLGTTGPMSRSLTARYAPPERVARYYGLAALAGNATNVVGPLFVGLVTTWTASQRAGLLVAPVFLLAGVWVLMTLPKQGYRTADADGGPPA